MEQDDRFSRGMQQIRERMREHERKRELLLAHSRQIQKDAKVAIFSLHKGDDGKAQGLLDDAQKRLSKLVEEHAGTPLMPVLGPAMEEYAEAQILRTYLAQGRIPTHIDIAIPHEQYVGGLCDFIGELVRYAYAQSFKKDMQFIVDAAQTANDVYAHLLELECKGELRRKFDAVKYSIQKLEHLLFEINIARMRR